MKPCQDVSSAGKRAGVRPGTRSGLWTHMAYAISQLRPALVVIENVRGLLSADAHSDLERDCWCVGDERESPLRALGAVLGDLADVGYDARWATVPASAVGAPHRRERVFIIAHPADADLPRWEGSEPAQRRVLPAGGDHGDLLKTPTAQLGVNGGTQHPDKRRAGGHGPTLADQVEHLLPTPVTEPATGNGHARNLSAEVLFPTPKASDGPNGGPGMRNGRGEPDALPGVVALLPTPAVNDMGQGKTVEAWDMRAKHGNGNGHGPSLSIEALRLLPTPKATNNENRQSEGFNNNGENYHDIIASQRFGQYAAAIARWERVLGRPAPAPTEPTGKGGRHRLSPEFVTWLMGLPDGHVTDVPGLSYAAQLKALGNGVVPQQAAMALRWLLTLDEAPA